MYEKHSTPKEVAQRWGYSEDTILKLFRERKGVIAVGTPPGRGRRPRITIRIPESLEAKVYSEISR